MKTVFFYKDTWEAGLLLTDLSENLQVLTYNDPRHLCKKSNDIYKQKFFSNKLFFFFSYKCSEAHPPLCLTRLHLKIAFF